MNPRTVLLQVLIAGEGYGFDLIKRVEKRTGGKLTLGRAIFPALRGLERDRLIESYEGESLPELGGWPRIYYRLTGEGRRAAFADWSDFTSDIL